MKIDHEKMYAVTGKSLELIVRLSERLYDGCYPITADEKRDWANWLSQVFVESAEEI